MTKSKVARVYTDGAIRPKRNNSGLGVIVRDDQGQIRHWWKKRVGSLTCNEAEYAAVIFALEQILRIPTHARPSEVAVYSDSRVVVDQMQGRAAANAPALQRAKTHLQSLCTRFKKVVFYHIPRESNRMADALACEAVDGLYQPGPSTTNEKLHDQVIREYFETWE